MKGNKIRYSQSILVCPLKSLFDYVSASASWMVWKTWKIKEDRKKGKIKKKKLQFFLFMHIDTERKKHIDKNYLFYAKCFEYEVKR